MALGNEEQYRQACLLCDNKNYDKAFEIFLSLAKNDDVDAQDSVAYLYNNGLGVTKDSSLAEHWWDESIKSENENAMYNKACHLLDQNNTDEAISLLEEASLHDQEDALHLLGGYYFHGIHVVKDQKKAISYFQKAAIMSHSEAFEDFMSALSIVYNQWQVRAKMIKFVFLSLRYKIKTFLISRR